MSMLGSQTIDQVLLEIKSNIEAMELVNRKLEALAADLTALQGDEKEVTVTDVLNLIKRLDTRIEVIEKLVNDMKENPFREIHHHHHYPYDRSNFPGGGLLPVVPWYDPYRPYCTTTTGEDPNTVKQTTTTGGIKSGKVGVVTSEVIFDDPLEIGKEAFATLRGVKGVYVERPIHKGPATTASYNMNDVITDSFRMERPDFSDLSKGPFTEDTDERIIDIIKANMAGGKHE